MPIPTAFQQRTSALCESHEWRDWSGYLAAGSYEPGHDREYYAIRNAVGLIDVSPLCKYDVTGPDALRLLNKVIPRNLSRFEVDQIKYSPWCDEEGKIIDDGTVWRLGEDWLRVTAAHPNLRWLQDCGFGMDVEIVDRSSDLAALALQGPSAKNVLAGVFPGDQVENINYYRIGFGRLRGISDDIEVTITRTGFTGDLGYELWVNPAHALLLWDAIVEIGINYGLLPCGMVALDMARIEAGLLLIDVDYIAASKALTEARKSSPYEAGLGWTMSLGKGPFVGRTSLAEEFAAGSKWSFAGLELDWQALEKLFAAQDLPPLVAGRASREAVHVYNDRGRQVGQVTSRTFSPILKKYIALATMLPEYGQPGKNVNVEITVEFAREMVPARVVELPFYDPPHKRE
jgi:aminomethyltransferase